jgi:cytochrome P450
MAEKGSGGRVIGGYYLPEGTKAIVHPFAIHRDSRNFSPAPERFMPERWLQDSASTGVHNQAAFIPFSFGPAICVGKNLAYQEMRMTVAYLVRRFEFAFVPGWDKENWEANIRDLFVTMRGPLMITVKERKGGSVSD